MRSIGTGTLVATFALVMVFGGRVNGSDASGSDDALSSSHRNVSDSNVAGLGRSTTASIRSPDETYLIECIEPCVVQLDPGEEQARCIRTCNCTHWGDDCT